MEEAQYRLKHLDGFFAGQRIATINPARITAYVANRQREGQPTRPLTGSWKLWEKC